MQERVKNLVMTILCHFKPLQEQCRTSITKLLLVSLSRGVNGSGAFCFLLPQFKTKRFRPHSVKLIQYYIGPSLLDVNQRWPWLETVRHFISVAFVSLRLHEWPPSSAAISEPRWWSWTRHLDWRRWQAVNFQHNSGWQTQANGDKSAQFT